MCISIINGRLSLKNSKQKLESYIKNMKKKKKVCEFAHANLSLCFWLNTAACIIIHVHMKQLIQRSFNTKLPYITSKEIYMYWLAIKK